LSGICATFLIKTNIVLKGQALGKLNFGVFIPFYALQSQTKPNELFTRLCDVVFECERLGYHSVWIDDHLMFGKTPLLECWSTLAALASVTRHIRLGTMVTSAAFRNPALLAKAAATIDIVSNGRLEFGMGAGVQREEHEAYGFTFPNPSARINRLREAVEIIKAMWTEEKINYKGKHFLVNSAFCEPKPVQKPYPPIVIGGGGENLTLKVTAQFADRVDFGYLPGLTEYTHKLRVLENHCSALGRPFMEVEKSCWPAGQIILGENPRELDEKISRLKPKNVSRRDYEKYTFAGNSTEFSERLRSYEELGVTHFMLAFADLPETSSLRSFAQRTGKFS